MPPHQTIAGERLTGFRRNSLNAAECFIPGTVVPAGNLPTLQSEVPATVVIPLLNIDWSVGVKFSKTISASSIFTFSNAADGRSIKVAITTTGAFTVTWPAGIKWPNGIPVAQTSSGTDIYTVEKFGSVISVSYVAQNMG